eukprot:TRINITY_DN110639_c0_g1_i1.p1 TRINITY_DN110639_c0_g1~~TRINITY_DN110639_c0_g1_i1.p1  ORF type:complete len:328 (-),score=74.88 TRINITY_DN110639_c0_g1_i1:18-962(-)
MADLLEDETKLGKTPGPCFGLRRFTCWLSSLLQASSSKHLQAAAGWLERMLQAAARLAGAPACPEIAACSAVAYATTAPAAARVEIREQPTPQKQRREAELQQLEEDDFVGKEHVAQGEVQESTSKHGVVDEEMQAQPEEEEEDESWETVPSKTVRRGPGRARAEKAASALADSRPLPSRGAPASCGAEAQVGSAQRPSFVQAAAAKSQRGSSGATGPPAAASVQPPAHGFRFPESSAVPRRRRRTAEETLAGHAATQSQGPADCDDDDGPEPFVGGSHGWSKQHKAGRSVKLQRKVDWQVARRIEQSRASRGL